MVVESSILIANILQAQGLTDAGVAETLQVSERTIKRIRNREHKPLVPLALRLCALLGVDPREVEW